MKNTKTLRFTLSLLSFMIMYGFTQAQTTITTEPFTKIKTEGTVNVELKHSNTYSVIIESEDNNTIEAKVKDGMLSISNSKKAENTKIIVNYQELEGIIASGVSTITSTNVVNADEFYIKASGATKIKLKLNVDELESHSSGAAKITLSGSADSHTIKMSGASNIKAFDLETDRTDAKISGASMAYVNASDELFGNLSGVSQLKYTGDPDTKEINKEQTVTRIIETKINDNEIEDSIKIKIGNLNIEVIDSDTPKIRIGDNEINIGEQGNITFDRKTKKPHFDGHWSGFDIGVNGYLNSNNKTSTPEGYEFMDLNYPKSINVQINFFEQNFNLIQNHFGLITGLGLEYNNYRFDKDVILDADAETFTGLYLTDTDRDYTKSKLVVNYLNIPLLLEYQTNARSNKRSFHITAGVVGGLRIGSHSKNVYEDGGKHKDKNRDDFNLNPFKVSAMARIGWGKINLYGSYSLIEMFETDKGPELYPFSIGISLVNF